MTNEPGRAGVPPTADASLAQAGEPQRLSEARDESEGAAQTPSHEELDARESNFTRPRKPMGPTEGIAQTSPEELDE